MVICIAESLILSSTIFCFHIRWMPSHLKPYDARPPGVSHLDIAGNNFADVEAGKAAKTFCVELNASSQFFHWRKLAGRIQRRMVAIIQNLPERKTEKQAESQTTAPPPFAEDYEALYPLSSHVLFECGNWVKCARCSNSCHSKSKNLRDWIMTDCPDVGCSHDRPRPFPMERCVVGNMSVHPTHRLNLFRCIFIL